MQLHRFFKTIRMETIKEKFNITINLTDNNGATKFFDKYELLSPELEDSNLSSIFILLINNVLLFLKEIIL